MLSKYDLHYLVNHFFSGVSGVLVCVPFDVSFLCVFLLFVCNPAKVCLREKEDSTISCVVCFFVVVLCCFFAWSMFSYCLCIIWRVFVFWRRKYGLSICCAALLIFLMYVCLYKKGVLTLFLLHNVVFLFFSM